VFVARIAVVLALSALLPACGRLGYEDINAGAGGASAVGTTDGGGAGGGAGTGGLGGESGGGAGGGGNPEGGRPVWGSGGHNPWSGASSCNDPGARCWNARPQTWHAIP
jgi:hypothetical protein